MFKNYSADKYNDAFLSYLIGFSVIFGLIYTLITIPIIWITNGGYSLSNFFNIFFSLVIIEVFMNFTLNAKYFLTITEDTEDIICPYFQESQYFRRIRQNVRKIEKKIISQTFNIKTRSVSLIIFFSFLIIYLR